MNKSLATSLSKAVAIGAMLVATATSHAFTEGTDYVKLDKEIPNAKGTLIKVFSYACPFCYKYDKSVTPAVVPKLPQGIVFRPFHLESKGDNGPQATEVFAVLIVHDQDKGVALTAENSAFKKAKMAYYAAYHDKKERWSGGPDAFIKTGLDAAGMSRADFDAAKATPKVQKLLAEWKPAYDVAKVQGVPGFVVNGKYLIMTKSITSIDGMVDLIKELAAK